MIKQILQISYALILLATALYASICLHQLKTSLTLGAYNEQKIDNLSTSRDNAIKRYREVIRQRGL